ncbi:hypothetical protein NA57DRAFT_52288 [Rhizodiscina lignyota]|uniref:Uncharacterized protein n=1 Tax=Rhizodiscina lignyota TaxID=1504668 RepID=A0A9P4IKC4_9PEZI|nr:hypothetical protein NA57DRAFT_52288 [Rhizodiscina lignyota]
MSSDGTKFTSSSERYDNPTQEGTGFVASDSLAAESMRDSSSGFASNDPNAGASGQAAYGATASNTDTSGATRLDPASDAQDRFDRQGGYDERSELNSARGTGKEGGVGPTYNVGGGDSYGSGGGQRDDTYSTSRSGADSYGADGSGNAGAAPSYVGANERAQDSEARGGPHGRNIQEGGFDDSAPNASFNQDIGGENDPGRYSERQFQKTDAQSGYDAGGSGPRQDQISGGNTYGELRNDQDA